MQPTRPRLYDHRVNFFTCPEGASSHPGELLRSSRVSREVAVQAAFAGRWAERQEATQAYLRALVRQEPRVPPEEAEHSDPESQDPA